MNVFPNNTRRVSGIPTNNSICPPIANPIIETPRRRRLDGLDEGDIILVQTPSGICEQGVFIRIEDGFLIWARSFDGGSFISVTSLDAISITKL